MAHTSLGATARSAVMFLSLLSLGGAHESTGAENPAARPPLSGRGLDGLVLPRPEAPALRGEVAIPAGVSRVELTREGQKWIDFQTELAKNSLAGTGAPRLVDGTTFLSDPTRKVLSGFVGASSGDEKIRFKAVDEGGYKFAFVTSNGDTWYVTESPFYKDQFPTGIPFHRAALELWKAGSDKMIQKEFLGAAVFKNDTHTVDFDALRKVMKAAEDSHASERRDTAGIKDFKLTDRPTGYIALVDGNKEDPIMAGLINDAKMFPQLLNSFEDERGRPLHNLVVREGSEFLEVRGDPKALLESKIQDMHDRGIRSFYLNFAGHGNETGIFFTTRFGSERLSPDDLHAVFSKFKDCDFVVDTVACYGGGMADKMKEYRDPAGREGRILFKLQAKPFSYNQEGRLEGETGIAGSPKVHSSYYQVFNAYYLARGKSFGEAHLLADVAAKKLIPCDAEAWLSGGRGGRGTLKDY